MSFIRISSKEMHIGLAGPIRVISVTHCGELGWMLYIPNEVFLEIKMKTKKIFETTFMETLSSKYGEIFFVIFS